MIQVRDMPRFIEAVRELRLEQRRYAELKMRGGPAQSASSRKFGGIVPIDERIAESAEKLARLKREIDFELGI